MEPVKFRGDLYGRMGTIRSKFDQLSTHAGADNSPDGLLAKTLTATINTSISSLIGDPKYFGKLGSRVAAAKLEYRSHHNAMKYFNSIKSIAKDCRLVHCAAH